ncbi:MAG: VanW family protein [Clostridia bacterium]
MSKKIDENNNSNIISIIAIALIILIATYIIYMLYKNNKILNSNDLKENIAKLSDNTNIINTSDNNVLAKKEIVYVDKEIASYTSTLYDNQESRVYNITKACSILNGTIIKPGEEFSFNNTIGPMGEENGFKKATGFDSDGKLIQISGGGMCQISSTLYNVALLANLEITERHAHSRRVNYVPADKDATIYYGSLDLKFINNTDSDIKITAENDNYSVTIKMFKKEQSN